MAYPRLAIYGSSSSFGEPFVNQDGQIISSVVQDYARHQLAILNSTPLTDTRKDIAAALKAANPNLKLFSYSMPATMWCGTQYPENSYYRHLWNLLKSLSGASQPYDCNEEGDAFLFLQSGVTPYQDLSFNINLARRRLENGTYKYYVAEAVADLMYNDIHRATQADNSKIWDGHFFDVYCDSLTWVESSTHKFDYARAGYGSNNNDAANRDAFMQGWNGGFKAFAARMRALIGDNSFPLVGNCGQGKLYTDFNGWMSENFPFQNGGTWFSNMFREIGGHLLYDRLFRSPSYNFIYSSPSNPALPFSADSQRKVRFGLASASILDGGFAAYGESSVNANLYPYYSWWYDEYSVDLQSGSSVKSKQYLGWLGAALGSYYQQIWADNTSRVPNGDFESTPSGWTFRSFQPASATTNVETGSAAQAQKALKLDITAPGSAGWHANLSAQSNFSITYGQPQVLTFWAKASKLRNIEIALSGDAGAPLGYQLLPLTTEWKRYQVVIWPSASATAGNIRFDLATETGTIWLDDILLQNTISNVYRRDFSNGTILLNPQASALNVPLPSAFKKIAGSISPIHNDGSYLNMGDILQIPASDAFFLLNPGDTLAPAKVENLSKN